MKFGMRTPSLKKSIKARTTGKAKRAIKKAVIPGYGKKGMGWIKNPKKAAYNKVYKKTSFSIMDLFKLNILVRQSRLSGFIRATVPVIGSHQKCYAAKGSLHE